jgi:ComF family protein
MFELRWRSVNLRWPDWLTIAQNLASLVAPPVCALCGGPGRRQQEIWGIDLCAHCEAACPRVAQACSRCAEPLPCTRCVDSPPSFDAALALFRYEDPVDLMITSLKFQAELGFARVLGTLLAQAVRVRGGALPLCLIPMPLHLSRLRERGFNQCEAIAAHAARRLDIRMDARLLYRTRATLPQSGLAATARAVNLRGAFAVRDGRTPPAHVALLDDVMTTGHTAEAAASALKAAGCQRVEIWTCARAARLDAAKDCS